MKTIRIFRWQKFEYYQLATLGILVVIFFTSLISFLFKVTQTKHFVEVFCITVLYTVAVMIISRIKNKQINLLVQSCLTVSVLLIFYIKLGFIAFDVIPYNGDVLLAKADRLIFLGADPVLWAERFAKPAILMVLSFSYAVFIPYLYFSIFMSFLGRPVYEKRVFITSFTVTYAISFLGYLFVPARGPIVHYAAEFMGPLVGGGVFHRIIIDAIDKCGGPHGAFPSLHIGATWFICYFDLKFNRIRGLLYVPLVVLIFFATIVLRYHFIVDLLAGFLIATFAVHLAIRLSGTNNDGLKVRSYDI